MNNRGVVFRGAGQVELVEQAVAEPGSGEIVVKVGACGVCGSDVAAWRTGAYYPPGAIIGHEFAGTVTAVGDKVKDVPLDSLVTINPALAFVGIGGQPGGFADYVLIANAQRGVNVHVMPASMTAEQAALTEPLSVSLHAVNLVGPKPSDKVAVLGAGPIGLCALAACRALGVEEVVVSDISPLRLRVATKLGASAVFDAREGSIVDFLYERFGGYVHPFMGFKVPQTASVYECAGISQTIIDGLLSLDHGGTCMLIASHKPFEFDPNLLMSRELKLRSSMWTTTADFAQAAGFLADGTVDLSPMISHRFPLEEIETAIQTQAEADKAVKVVVTPAEN